MRVAIVFDVAGLQGVNGVVPSHTRVRARKPFATALPEDDVSGNHVLFCLVGKRAGMR